MSQAVITKAFTEWKAQQAIDNQPVTLDEFIFAFIPDLDVEKPIDNTETTPPADKIVHRQAVSKSGVINGDSVVYSVTLGADIGDFDFNWIGLANKATGTLAMIIHAPTQRKIKNASGQQGNVLVRSMLMEYSGAQAATNITTPAETWQIDFTARLASMDERHRRENVDLYGAAAFFDNGYLVAKSGTQYFVTKGAGYVAGLRTELAANQNIAVSAKPVKVWLDVCWSGTLTSEWAVKSKITVAANLTDYVESGVNHYVFAVASIDASGNISDLRPKGSLDDQAASDALKKHEQSRNHPDATTGAKGFVQLSSETDSESETLAATPKAVSAAAKAIKDTLGTSATKDVVTSKTDTTAERVLTTGWMSLGGYGTDNLIAAADARKSLRNGFYAVSNEPTYGNSSLISFGYDSGSQVHIIAKQGGQTPLLGVCGSTPQGDYGNWGKIYTEFQKPTALDVGAVPYQGPLNDADLNTVRGTQYGRFCQPLSASATTARHYPIAEAGALDVHQTSANGAEGCVQEYRGFISRRIFLRTYNPGDSTWTDWCEFYTTAKKPTASDVGAIPLAGSANVTGIVRSSTELQSSYANSFRIGYGGYGTFWRNDGANLYLMLTNKDDPWGNYNALRPFRVSVSNGDVVIGKLNLSDFTYFDARYYTRTLADSTFQPKGSYTPAGEAYTKGESNARFLQGWRLSAVATATNGNNDNLFAEAPNGSVVVSVQQKTNYTAVKYRYAQYNLNGTWYNAGVAA